MLSGTGSAARQHVAVALALTLVALLTSLYFVYYYELCARDMSSRACDKSG